MKIVLVIALGVLISACAVAPKNIAPSFTSDQQYTGTSCGQLHETETLVQTKLNPLLTEQQRAHTMGIVWATLGTLVTWPAYFGMIPAKHHDHATEIANLKGQEEVLQKEIAARCQPRS